MNDILEIWVKKIRGNDAIKVSELYHKNGLLLGTFSDIERHGRELIFSYFENLLKSKVDVEIISQHKYKTDTITTSSGFYNFIVNGKIIRARYSFVFLKVEDKWKILSHHSSVLPEKD